MVFRWRPNMLSYLMTHLLLQLPFGSLSILPALMLLYLTIATQIKAMAKAKAAKVDFILMILAELLTLIFTWYY